MCANVKFMNVGDCVEPNCQTDKGFTQAGKPENTTNPPIFYSSILR